MNPSLRELADFAVRVAKEALEAGNNFKESREAINPQEKP